MERKRKSKKKTVATGWEDWINLSEEQIQIIWKSKSMKDLEKEQLNNQIRNQQILEIITEYFQQHPGQRFGQMLYNLGINESNLTHIHALKDNYHDSNERILERVKKAIVDNKLKL